MYLLRTNQIAAFVTTVIEMYVSQRLVDQWNILCPGLVWLLVGERTKNTCWHTLYMVFCAASICKHKNINVHYDVCSTHNSCSDHPFSVSIIVMLSCIQCMYMYLLCDRFTQQWLICIFLASPLLYRVPVVSSVTVRPPVGERDSPPPSPHRPQLKTTAIVRGQIENK